MSSEQLTDHTVTLPPTAPIGPAARSAPPLDGRVAEPGGEKQVLVDGRPLFPQKLLNVGFCAALVLAGACLITGALYLNTFLSSTNEGVQALLRGPDVLPPDSLNMAINARLVMARMALLSCGVFIGMSFGFLGFALFLLGIKEEMSVAARSEHYFVKLARLSPGVFVILCASVLIGICVTRETPFSYYYKTSQPQSEPTARQESQPQALKGHEDTSQP